MIFLLVAASAAAVQPAGPNVIVAPPAIVQDPAPASAEPTAEMVEEAMKLFEGPALRDQMLAGVMMGLNEGAQSRMGGGEALNEATAHRIQEALLEEFKTIIDAEIGKVRREAALLYARRFTLDELRELNRLMDIPGSRSWSGSRPS